MTARLDMSASPTGQMLQASFASGDPVVAVARLAEGLPSDVRAGLTALGYGLRVNSSSPDESLVGEALASRVLELCCGARREQMTFRRAPGGKPQVEIDCGTNSFTPAISVSHADNVVVAAACATGRVGVDIEPVRRVPWRVAERVFDAEDRSALLELTPSARAHALTRLWTVAEACAKGAGHGIGQLLAGFDRLGLERRGRWRGFRWSAEALDVTRWCALSADACDPGRRPPAAEVTLDWLLESA